MLCWFVVQFVGFSVWHLQANHTSHFRTNSVCDPPTTKFETFGTMSTTVDPRVLQVTKRVATVLDVISKLDGPKERWTEWAVEGFEKELVSDIQENFIHLSDFSQKSIPPATRKSPQTKLLGSLDRLLMELYSGACSAESLNFRDVISDDPRVEGEEYEEISLESLPDLVAENAWWMTLPESSKHIDSLRGFALCILYTASGTTPSNLVKKRGTNAHFLRNEN